MGIPGPRSLGHGFHAVSVPLPFRSPAWVNCYLIEGDRLTLLDCGVDWEDGLEALEGGLRDVGFQPASIDRLVVTHLHPDHVGMAPRLSQRWRCEIVMHERSVDRIPRYNDTAGFAESIRGLARRHGVPETMRPGFVDVATRAPFMPLMRDPDQVVADGDHFWVFYRSLNPDQVIRIPVDPSRGGLDFFREFLDDPTSKYDIRSEEIEQIAGVTTMRLFLDPNSPRGLESARVWVDPSARLIRKLEIVDENGLVRTVLLSDFAFDPELVTGHFEFDLPEGVDVVSGG